MRLQSLTLTHPGYFFPPDRALRFRDLLVLIWSRASRVLTHSVAARYPAITSLG